MSSEFPVYDERPWVAQNASQAIKILIEGLDLEHFKKLPELSAYTSSVSPGIVKKITVEGKVYVVQSVPDVETQQNEVLMSILVGDSLQEARAVADDRATNVDSISPLAVKKIGGFRLVTVMPFAAGPTLEAEALLGLSDDEQKTVLSDVLGIYEILRERGISWRDMALHSVL